MAFSASSELLYYDFTPMHDEAALWPLPVDQLQVRMVVETDNLALSFFTINAKVTFEMIDDIVALVEMANQGQGGSFEDYCPWLYEVETIDLIGMAPSPLKSWLFSVKEDVSTTKPISFYRRQFRADLISVTRYFPTHPQTFGDANVKF